MADKGTEKTVTKAVQGTGKMMAGSNKSGTEAGKPAAGNTKRQSL